MCTLVMSFEDPLSVATSSRKTLVGTDCSDTASILDEAHENKDESTPVDPESERRTSVQLYQLEDSQPTVETSTEEQNTHRINANNWCIAVVTIVVCLMFFLYYCF